MPIGSPAPGAPLRPRTGIAWTLIALGVAAITVLGSVLPDRTAGNEAAVNDDMAVQFRLQYGIREVQGSLPGGAAAAGAIPWEKLEKQYGRGPAAQRQRFAVVAGDEKGPSAALAVLDGLETLLRSRGRALEGRAAEVQAALRALYGGGGSVLDPRAPERLTEERRALLREELGWFGDLALAPPGSPAREVFLAPAKRTATRLLVIGLFLLLASGAGTVGALVFWVLVLRGGGPRFRLAPGSTPHGVYAETFAAWLLLFIAVSLAASLLLRLGLPRGALLPLEGIASLLTLGALAWPVLRGVPWGTVRDDLGLRLSAEPLRDALAGAACWFTGLPVMAAGFGASLLLEAAAREARGEPDPLAARPTVTHPIVGEVARGESWLLVFLLAAVVAPLVEEIFFRGVLYRHLRDATGGRGRAASVLLSWAVSGAIFASLHPQGPTFVPALMAVAWALVQAREWRGSLLAPMAVHALHNGMLTVSLYALYGS
jgi:membrane protease YdiL (CAAX protease family)